MTDWPAGWLASRIYPDWLAGPNETGGGYYGYYIQTAWRLETLLHPSGN